MKPFQKFFYITAIVALASHIGAVPVEPSSTAEPTNSEQQQTADIQAPVTENIKVAAKENVQAPTTNTGKDLETSSSNQAATYVLPQHHSSGGTSSGTYDPSIYAGYLTPEAFQQYLAQFAGAFGPYGYPGYGPAPVYPAPYTVQTGYDGILIPSTSTSLSASGAVTSNSGSILTALSNLIPTFMGSTIFRVIASILAVLLMLLMGGAATTAICNLTPLCDISFKAVSYLRGKGNGNMARMLTEEMTPDRVRRASEVVRSAIRKYKELQKVMTDDTNINE